MFDYAVMRLVYCIQVENNNPLKLTDIIFILIFSGTIIMNWNNLIQ